LSRGVKKLTLKPPEGGPLTGTVAGHILDHYLGEPARDDTASVRKRWQEQEEASANVEKEWVKAREKNARPSRPLADYAGAYDDRLGLEVGVRLEADTLRLRYGGGEPATLVPWHHDVFRAVWQNPFHARIMPTFVTFDLDEAGAVTRLHMAPNRDEIDARRRPAP
jgi:uncharacterized protein DUF3471